MKTHTDKAPPPEQADAFLAAVGRGDQAALRAALEQNPALINGIGKHPYWGGRPHPLHVAIDTDREEIFDFLLAAGADIEGRGAEYDNWTPLMLALNAGRTGMAETLTDLGASENICTALLRADDRALDRALAQPEWRAAKCPSGSLIGLARTPHAVHRLIDAGLSPHGKDRWGADAMESLSRLGAKGRELVAALAEHGAPPSAEHLARIGDEERLKALADSDPSLFEDPKVITAAVDFGHLDLAKWLLHNGGDVNARQQFGSGATALHSAAWNGDLAMVECLLAQGADTTALDTEHKTTPLVWAQTARKVTNNPRCDEVAAILARLI